jgi:hypothetical protein
MTSRDCEPHACPKHAQRGHVLALCRGGHVCELLPVSFILSVPSLEDLSPDELDSLYTQVAALEADLRARLLTRRPIPLPVRALTLDQAVMMLGCSRAWLGRKTNWTKYGGYLDLDRRVKFSEAALAAYVSRRGQV